VRLWARDASLVHEMTTRRANAVYLPGVHLPDAVSLTDSMSPRWRDEPSSSSRRFRRTECRAVMQRAAPHLARGRP